MPFRARAALESDIVNSSCEPAKASPPTSGDAAIPARLRNAARSAAATIPAQRKVKAKPSESA